MNSDLQNHFGIPDAFIKFFEWASILLETIGIAVLLIAAFMAIIHFIRSRYLDREKTEDSFASFRTNLGRGILLSLEFLVAADIVGTVAVDPTWDNVGILAVVVIIRTFLSFALEVEIHGRLPWKQKS